MDIDLDSVSADTPSASTEKRVRKTVSRLSEVYDKSFELNSEKKMKPVVGGGVRLGEISRIQDASQRSKLSTDLVQSLHLLCYRTKGKAGKRLAAVKKFNGFDSADDAEFRKRVSLAEKMKSDDLRLMGDLLNAHPTGGKQKSDVIRAIVEYLRAPFDTGSDSFRTNALKRRQTAATSGKAKAPSTTEASSAESATNKENRSGSRKPRKSTTKRTESPLAEATERKRKLSDDTGSEEPSDARITEQIEAILREIDIDTTTLSGVCDRVAARFPQHDLVHRRDHIRSLVKQVIEQS